MPHQKYFRGIGRMPMQDNSMSLPYSIIFSSPQTVPYFCYSSAELKALLVIYVNIVCFHDQLIA